MDINKFLDERLKAGWIRDMLIHTLTFYLVKNRGQDYFKAQEGVDKWLTKKGIL